MILHVKVIPNCKEELIEKISENEYRIKVKEKPIGGRANKRVIDLISNEFGVKTSNIMIKNPNSRRKIIKINI